MANTSAPGEPQATPSTSTLASSSRQEPETLVLPPDELSSDSNLEDDPLFANPEDAQSIFQPALSPAATRLTSPKTPAAEKAAAMEKLPGGGIFGAFEGTAVSNGATGALPRKLVKQAPNRQNRGLSLCEVPPRYVSLPKLPSPWQSGAKDIIVQNDRTSRPALSGVFGGTRHSRSSSGGAEAFRKLKDALPNITLPTNLWSSLRSPSFLSDGSSQKSPGLEAKQTSTNGSIGSPQVSSYDGIRDRDGHLAEGFGESSLRTPSTSLNRPRAIRRSTSDDSMLYHSLSRVSSLGDDDRWGDVTEMANVRFKAIKESFDKPSFKLPQFPHALKKHSLLSSSPPHEKNPIGSPTLNNSGSFHKDPYPELGQALETLTGDIVVMVWVPVKVGLNIRKVNLEVGLEPEDEERMEETIYPSDRGATVIAHSLGGMITRHAINQRPDLFAGVVFAGTPQRCINILGPIRNGDAVLLNEKVLTAQVNFSLRTSFAFLPEDGFCFVNKNTGENFPIDFYDAEEWAKHALSPCVGPTLPAYNIRQSALGSLRSFSASFPSLPTRSRGNSTASDLDTKSTTRYGAADAARQVEVKNDHTLAPQMGSRPGGSGAAQQQQAAPKTFNEQERYMKYLKRTLSDTKRFRAELHHRAELTESNMYPPMAVIYGKEIPTVYAAHVTNRDQIPCADAYDDLLFRSGDGVVLSREAMLPPGYDVVKDGRISTDRGHITMLGDMQVVGRALQAVLRGRQKGIGLGTPTKPNRPPEATQTDSPSQWKGPLCGD
ncbi:hypothetical protein TruAng_005585 [Truncatella angustata]|nr:hypothetical protein TruAng_005585 [Truncatella angustata]